MPSLEIVMDTDWIKQKLNGLRHNCTAPLTRYESMQVLTALLAAREEVEQLRKCCSDLLSVLDHQEAGGYKKSCWCTDTGTGTVIDGKLTGDLLACAACKAREALASPAAEKCSDDHV
jgi:hypothetical protein